MKYTRQSIGREAALALIDKKWWEGKSSRDIAEFQMLTAELCMPFGDFHKAIEEAVGRPIFTHEFGMNWDGIVAELFDGAPAPSFDEILEMIPADKRIVITV
jgi:hypothetical protein